MENAYATSKDNFHFEEKEKFAFIKLEMCGDAWGMMTPARGVLIEEVQYNAYGALLHNKNFIWISRGTRISNSTKRSEDLWRLGF